MFQVGVADNQSSDDPTASTQYHLAPLQRCPLALLARIRSGCGSCSKGYALHAASSGASSGASITVCHRLHGALQPQQAEYVRHTLHVLLQRAARAAARQLWA